MLDFIKQKKNLLVIIGIIIMVGLYWVFNMSTTTQDITTLDNMLEVAENTEEETESDEDIIIVHITGGVNKPGIVKLKENSRIEDAIEAAGGLTEDSDISNVNLAYMLEDGIKIRIPLIDDSEDSIKKIILQKTAVKM